MSTVEITVLQRFKKGLVQFLDELINWMPEDSELVMTRILIQDTLPIEEVMKKFVLHVKPHQDKIEKKDEQFFLNDPEVFGTVKDRNRVLSLKKLWINPSFASTDKEKAWKWMSFFLKCINLYLEHKT